MYRLTALLVLSALSLTAFAYVGSQTGETTDFQPYAGLTLDEAGDLYGTMIDNFSSWRTPC
jgi:hypothetical protein